MLFIIQVAAVSCADTQVPETTLANQSLLKVGFCKAIQLEVLVIRIGASSAPKMHQDRLCRYRIRHRVNFSRTPEPSSISRILFASETASVNPQGALNQSPCSRRRSRRPRGEKTSTKPSPAYQERRAVRKRRNSCFRRDHRPVRRKIQ